MKLPPYLFALMLVLSCCSNEGKTATDNNTATADKTTTQVPAATDAKKPQYLISTKGIMGIAPGQYIGDHIGVLRASSWDEDGSQRKTYSIVTEDGKRIGYVQTHPDEPTIIDRIIVTFATAATEANVSVGWKLATLKRLYPDARSERMPEKKGFSQVTYQGLRYEFKTRDDMDVFDPAVIDETSFLYSITILP